MSPHQNDLKPVRARVLAAVSQTGYNTLENSTRIHLWNSMWIPTIFPYRLQSRCCVDYTVRMNVLAYQMRK